MTFSDQINVYLPIIDRLLRLAHGIQYTQLFKEVDPTLVKQLSPAVAAEAMVVIRTVYLIGILERSHLACVTSLARVQRWILAVELAREVKNSLAFAASLRGLLEAAADAHDVMQVLPMNLEKCLGYFHLVFQQHPVVDRVMVGFGELENKLIHYAYARRPAGNRPPMPHHVNKSNAEYIRVFEAFGVPNAKELYSELCELTHPAAASVSAFMIEDSTSLTLDFSLDESIISDMMQRYAVTISNLITFSINPSMISLAFLKRIIEDWPAPADEEIVGIGRVKQHLESFDEFARNVSNGEVDDAYWRRIIG